MNPERAILMGNLAGLKEHRTQLEAGIQANLSSVQTLLAGWRIRKYEEIDIESARYHLDGAAQQKSMLMQIRKDIKSIETELE